jgi:hypothetical protein
MENGAMGLPMAQGVKLALPPFLDSQCQRLTTGASMAKGACLLGIHACTLKLSGL